MNINFLGWPTTEVVDAQKLRPYFLEYAGEKWGSGGGSFTHLDNEWRVGLVLTHDTSIHGIAFLYTKDNLVSGDSEEWVTVSNFKDLTEFVGDDCDGYMPRGSFLPPEKAWQVLESFLIIPTGRSAAVDWIETSKLSWPLP
jgi:hypothetical protein